MDRIFKDEAARLGLAAWHRRFLPRAAVPAESRSVPTSLGPSHVLLAGDPAKPPLVCLHGSQAGSAHTLLELGLLADRYRIVAPDIPARSALGPQVRLPLKDDAQPRWLLEVLDGLGLGRIDLLGVSWGGFRGPADGDLRAAPRPPARARHARRRRGRVALEGRRADVGADAPLPDGPDGAAA